jgi:hypothetical protein
VNWTEIAVAAAPGLVAAVAAVKLRFPTRRNRIGKLNDLAQTLTGRAKLDAQLVLDMEFEEYAKRKIARIKATVDWWRAGRAATALGVAAGADVLLLLEGDRSNWLAVSCVAVVFVCIAYAVAVLVDGIYVRPDLDDLRAERPAVTSDDDCSDRAAELSPVADGGVAAAA